MLAPIEVRWLENAMAKLSDDVRGEGPHTQTLVEALLGEIDEETGLCVGGGMDGAPPNLVSEYPCLGVPSLVAVQM